MECTAQLVEDGADTWRVNIYEDGRFAQGLLVRWTSADQVRAKASMELRNCGWLPAEAGDSYWWSDDNVARVKFDR